MRASGCLSGGGGVKQADRCTKKPPGLGETEAILNLLKVVRHYGQFYFLQYSNWNVHLEIQCHVRS